MAGNRVKRQREYWNNLADIYEFKFGYDTRKGYAKLQHKVDRLWSAMGLKPDNTVLELGCGTGVYTDLLRQRGLTAVGLDISEKMLAIAERNGGEYYVGDIHHIPFLRPLFDAVVGFYVLQYADVAQVLRECSRVLKPNGKIGFIEPNVWNPLVFWKTRIGVVKRLEGISEHATSFSGRGLCKALATDFDNVSMQYLEYGINDSLLSQTPILKGISGSLLITGERKCHYSHSGLERSPSR